MAAIAGLQDFRKEGPPGDIGTFQTTCDVIVFQFTFSGTTNTAAIRVGVSGWVLLGHGTASVVIQAAIDYLPAQGGMVFIVGGRYAIDTTLTISSARVKLKGGRYETELYLDNGADCDLLQILDGGGNAVLEDIRLFGNKTNQTLAVHGVNFVITGIITNLLFQNVIVDNFKGCGFYNNSVQTVYASIFLNCYVESNDDHGYYFRRLANSIISNGYVYSNEVGIYLSTTSTRNIIYSNVIALNVEDGIYLDSSSENTILMNVITQNTFNGITVTFAIRTTRIISNYIVENERHGIRLWGVDYSIVLGNNIRNNSQEANNTYDGISIEERAPGGNGDNNIIAENIIRSTASPRMRFGIYNNPECDKNLILSNMINGINDHCIVVNDGYLVKIRDNHCEDSVAGSGIRLTGDSDNCDLDGNTCLNNNLFGIIIAAATCNDNWVGRNQFIGNGSGPFSDAGTNTQLETIPLYIVQYSNNTTHEDGVEIDEAGEWASFVGQLPLHVQQVVRFEIWAVGLAAPGANNQMCLTIQISGGAEDEPKTQHNTGALANQLSVTENTAIDDIIHWVCTHANALALLGGDSVKCVVTHNAAANSDIATDAAFRRVLAHVV